MQTEKFCKLFTLSFKKITVLTSFRSSVNKLTMRLLQDSSRTGQIDVSQYAPSSHRAPGQSHIQSSFHEQWSGQQKVLLYVHSLKSLKFCSIWLLLIQNEVGKAWKTDWLRMAFSVTHSVRGGFHFLCWSEQGLFYVPLACTTIRQSCAFSVVLYCLENVFDLRL